MNRQQIEAKIGDLVAEVGRVRRETVDARKWIDAYGIDSLAQLVFRETVERVLRVHIADTTWQTLSSINQLVDFVDAGAQAERVGGDASGVQVVDAGRSSASGTRLTRTGLLLDRIEIGMPLTGRNGLGETPLLKYVGDLRWRHISAMCGVPSKDIVDAEGHRLYATFFYVELAFPEARPMAAYGENDQLTVVSSMKSFGESLLDGTAYLLPAESPDVNEEPYPSVEAGVAAGVPSIRLSNIFVKQFDGAAWLKRSRPSSPGFRKITSLAEPPSSYATIKEVQQAGYFSRPDASYLPLTPGPNRFEYRLEPDRDLNGAGLVYFANYPLFVDIAERHALSVGERALSSELLDRRTLVRRRSAYLNNASASDALTIETEAWIQNPFGIGHATPELAPIRLFVNTKMIRQSDGRLMYISTAEKLIFNGTADELPFYSTLEAASK
jgi:probable biosynthetic protein (TIGR04098 family)